MKDLTIFDGAMGTMLQKHGLKGGEAPEIYNITAPNIIYDIHRAYIDAGSDVITANTFGANEFKLANTGYTVEQVISAAISIGKKAAKGKKVALDIGSTGKLMRPMGDLEFNKAYDVFSNMVKSGAEAGADIVLIETMMDLYECKAAILAAKENSKLPVYCTVTFQKDGRLLTGADPLTVVTVLESLGVDALGINCSLGPMDMMPIVEKMLSYTKLPIMVQPNAGLPSMVNGEILYNVNPEEFTEALLQMYHKGVKILGGCCGTTPEYVRHFSSRVNRKAEEFKKIMPRDITAISSMNRTIIIDDTISVIGQGINPTGKKGLQEAILNNDFDYIVQEALNQKSAGADILDINLGMLDINEKETMVTAVQRVQELINLPLQIDSEKEDVIEEAVRIYNGKPIINSVNGKSEIMKSIFPIVKKYGTAVIGLTLDEDGIHSKAEDRVKIAEKIIIEAEKYGIDKKNIIIDPLVLAASTQIEGINETLKAVSIIREKLGVKCVLGISNVSFGLPSRDIINRTFLALALQSGTNAVIMNTESKDMMDTLKAYRTLMGIDKNISLNYKKPPKTLKEMVIKGLKQEVIEETYKMIHIKETMSIVNEDLIPALEEVGAKYEKGELFLPQLLAASDAMKAAFNIIRNKFKEDGKLDSYRGRIILATVKGDIHDIGKNITKSLLENYGFEVIDLGKDVSYETIVKEIKDKDIELVGLSALMTTTAKNMEKTIAEIKNHNLKCKIMVGGAVITEDYSRKIGADYYIKDAMEAVRIACKIFPC